MRASAYGWYGSLKGLDAVIDVFCTLWLLFCKCRGAGGVAVALGSCCLSVASASQKVAVVVSAIFHDTKLPAKNQPSESQQKEATTNACALAAVPETVRLDGSHDSKQQAERKRRRAAPIAARPVYAPHGRPGWSLHLVVRNWEWARTIPESLA